MKNLQSKLLVITATILFAVILALRIMDIITYKVSCPVTVAKAKNNPCPSISNAVVSYTETFADINMELALVEGGMTDSFYIGMYEISQSQWEKVMGTSISQQRERANCRRSLYGEGDDYPMYYASWEEATAFCRLLSNKTGKNYMLPTEAQWEYAARGGKRVKETQYAGSNNIDSVAWFAPNSGNSTHPCGSKCANALGIYDMSGNVWEWCQDLSDNSSRVVKGGSWGNISSDCRIANRRYVPVNTRSYLIGFRVVCIP